MPPRHPLCTATLLTAFTLTGADLAHAQKGNDGASGPLTLTLTSFLIQNENGKDGAHETLLPAPAHATPGATLEHSVVAKNTSTGPLENVTLNLPVPGGTTFTAQSGPANASAEFSFDHGRTYGTPPLKRKVTKTEAGVDVTREINVLPSEYTNVRWTVKVIPAGESVTAAVRFTIR